MMNPLAMTLNLPLKSLQNIQISYDVQSSFIHVFFRILKMDQYNHGKQNLLQN